MTDQELNEQVARKLGWTFYEAPDDDSINHWQHPETDEVSRFYPKDYCTDIQAAWEIALQASDGGFRISRLGDQWICQMRDQIETADTAPEAICLAFLKVADSK